MHKETQCVSKTPFYYLVLIQKHIKRRIKKKHKNMTKTSVTKNSQNNYWYRPMHGFCSKWESYSVHHMIHAHTNMHVREHTVIHIKMGPIILPVEATTLQMSPKYFSSHYHGASFTSGCGKVHISLIVTQSCWGCSEPLSRFMSSLWTCSCRYNFQKTCGFLQVRLVAWSWKEQKDQNFVKHKLLALIMAMKQRQMIYVTSYLLRMTRACMVQGR